MTRQSVNCDNFAHHQLDAELSFLTSSLVWRTSNDSGHVLHTCLAVGHPVINHNNYSTRGMRVA
jgi:hypothetical protein